MSSLGSLLLMLVMSSFAASQNTTSMDGMLTTDVTSSGVGKFIAMKPSYEFSIILLTFYPHWLYTSDYAAA